MGLTKELKEKWLDALKSGQYIQGTRKLRRIDDGVIKHCCLGVLGEICSIAINESGGEFVNNSGSLYSPLLEYISNNVMEKLITANDEEYDLYKKNYSSVIPLIEELKTID